nr:hypothetical protein [Tanacetum cinerariifolium]
LVQRGLHAQVRIVRTDKGTKFLNKTFHAYFASEVIKHQTSVARTPEQNGVVERRKRTLVEAARTMLSAAKVHLFFWAEAIAKACFTQNHGENLDKMKEKGDACIFVGYSTQSRAYRVFIKRTRVIVETIHVNFDELPQMASNYVSSDPVPQCLITAIEHDSLSPSPQCQENVPIVAGIVTMSIELDLLFSLINGENLDKMKEKGDECIFVGHSTQSRAYRVFNKRTRALVHNSSDPALTRHSQALVHNSSDPALTRHSQVLVHNSSDPALTRHSQALVHNSSDPALTRHSQALVHNSSDPALTRHSQALVHNSSDPALTRHSQALVHNSSDPALTRHSKAPAHNSSDPAPTCQAKASVQISSDPASERQTMVLEHGSLSPGRNCQENVSHGDKTGTTSNELDLLFSLMFDELLNGSSKVVSKSSAVSAADAPNQRQQPTTPLTNQTTPAPTCQTPFIPTSVLSSENINQAEPHAENDQVADDEFINI